MTRLPTDRAWTPGPWSYRPAEFDDWGIVRAPNTQGQFAGGIICQAYDPEARDELTLAKHREARTDPWEANARLIAASPELLEALEGLERYLRDTPHHNAVQAAHARKIIAKARGQ